MMNSRSSNTPSEYVLPDPDWNVRQAADRPRARPPRTPAGDSRTARHPSSSPQLLHLAVKEPPTAESIRRQARLARDAAIQDRASSNRAPGRRGGQHSGTGCPPSTHPRDPEAPCGESWRSRPAAGPADLKDLYSPPCGNVVRSNAYRVGASGLRRLYVDTLGGPDWPPSACPLWACGNGELGHAIHSGFGGTRKSCSSSPIGGRLPSPATRCSLRSVRAVLADGAGVGPWRLLDV
jgi:hypothetical protein